MGASPQTSEYNNSNGFGTEICELEKGKAWILAI
jgi:hypothetical protein